MVSMSSWVDNSGKVWLVISLNFCKIIYLHIILWDCDAAALLNKYFDAIISDKHNLQNIMNRMKERFTVPNTLWELIKTNNWTNRIHKALLSKIILKWVYNLSTSDLEILSCWSDQLKQSIAYAIEHLKQNGVFIVEFYESQNMLNQNSFSAFKFKTLKCIHWIRS